MPKSQQNDVVLRKFLNVILKNVEGELDNKKKAIRYGMAHKNKVSVKELLYPIGLTHLWMDFYTRKVPGDCPMKKKIPRLKVEPAAGSP